jgi:3-oxoacyl-[acyl-carrier-protein] synthase III
MKWFTDMGAQIKMVSVARPRFGFHHVNSIRLSARAASQCLDDARIDPCDIGLLINTGVYRYKNTGEPAVAALIQKIIGSNRTTAKDTDNHKNTFSFDLNNGGCGLLTAIEIVEGSIRRGEINYGMVVTGDSEPFYHLSEEFTFNSAAAAIILAGTKNSGGFSMFRTYTYPEYSGEFVSSTYYSLAGLHGKGRNILNVMQKESYPDVCVDCAAKSLFNFLYESGMKLDDIDLIIPSQSPLGFTDKLKKRVGMNGNFIEIKKTGNMVFHTAGPAFALKKVWDDNRFRNSRNIIFLTIGSGINVSLALYQN